MVMKGSRAGKEALKSVLCAALWAALYGFVPEAVAQPTASSEQVRQYAIPSGSLSSGLSAWGAQSDRQLAFPPGLVRDKKTRGASGLFTREQALTQVLLGTGLTWEHVNGEFYTLKPADPQAPAGSQSQVGSALSDELREPPPPEPQPKDLQTMTVTGTRIRGADVASPVIEISSEDIEIQGFTDLGEVIRSIPQNFRGGENPGAVRISSSLGPYHNGNRAGGSALDLRGLGPGASLTLLNGRRLSYGADVQAVDITPIPVEAVERMEILTDGASAIYGSDAVGGVANVILKRDFEGVLLSADRGVATSGGRSMSKYSITAGTVWMGGGALISYADSSQDAIYADQRDYAGYLTSPYTIYPEIREKSALLSLNQSFGDSVDVGIDMLTSRRSQMLSVGYGSLNSTYLPETNSRLLSPVIDFWLTGDWRLSVSGSVGENKNEQKIVDTVVSTGETYPFSWNLDNKIRSYQLDAEGPLWSLRGGEARLALGGGYRKNEFYNSNPNARTYGGSDSSKFVYAEINLPFVGKDSNVRGVKELQLTGAFRSEEYDSFGGVTTPKVGILYSPSDEVSLKATWGKSFKAPTLDQRYQGRFGWIGYAASDGYEGPGGDDLVDMYITGGNEDLSPERANVWTATFSYRPSGIPGMKLDLSRFDIDYTNRIVDPIPNSQFALSNPVYSTFISLHPSLAEYEAVTGQLIDLDNYYQIGYSPDGLYAIIYAHLVNAERQRLRGFDFSGSQAFEMAEGELSFLWNLSWLDSKQQTLPGEEQQQLSGRIYNPAKLNARIGFAASFSELSGSVFVNHTGGSKDNYWSEDGSRSIASFNTVDATLRYRLGESSGAWAGTSFSLSATNLLGRTPPLFDAGSIYVLPYDPTNASSIGRYVTLSLSKKW